MERRALVYTVRQLAKMAGVSVRTLHHYDDIGLLKPFARTAVGYRLYGETELLRLQQILFFKELNVPLDEIRRILDDPDFDPVGCPQKPPASAARTVSPAGAPPAND